MRGQAACGARVVLPPGPSRRDDSLIALHDEARPCSVPRFYALAARMRQASATLELRHLNMKRNSSGWGGDATQPSCTSDNNHHTAASVEPIFWIHKLELPGVIGEDGTFIAKGISLRNIAPY